MEWFLMMTYPRPEWSD